MHRKPNSKSGLQTYLRDSGLLAHGSPKAIHQAKQTYRKNYHNAYKRERRKTFPEVTITLDKASFSTLSAAAREHRMTLAAFLREASMHYLEQKFLLPDPKILAFFAQRFRICASDIQLIAKHVRKLSLTELSESYQQLSMRIQQLESVVDHAFRHPPRA